MIGAIIGDIVGSRFEFNNHRSKEFELFTDECEATDDSIMTLAVAKAIMETEKITKSSLGDNSSEYYSILERMTIKYIDEVGVIAREIDNNYGIGFFDGKVYFTSNDVDYVINVKEVIEIL